MKSKVAIVRCKDYSQDELHKNINHAIELIGGWKNFVKRGDKVLLKPNLLTARPPESCAVTHPDFVRCVARIIKDLGAVVSVGDSPSGFGYDGQEEVYRVSGMKKMCQEEDIELKKFEKTAQIDGIPIAAPILEADVVISLPKLKTHTFMTLTGAVKNLFGAVPGLAKPEFHNKEPKAKDFAKILVDVYQRVKPHLNIMDGIMGMEGNGPATGEVRHIGLLLAGEDAVSIDAIFSVIAGLKPLALWTTQEAVRRNVGIADLDYIDILGERLEDVVQRNFKLPVGGLSFIERLPEPFIGFLRNSVRFWPEIEENLCKKCYRCLKSCPAGDITINKEASRIHHKKCILCLCCHEVCPYGAIKIKKSFMARLAGI